MKETIKYTLQLIVVQIVIIQTITGQGLPTAKPEKVGLASDRLERIKPFIQKYVDSKKLPGVITLIAKHGKVVHLEKYGMMDDGKPMQFNAIFRIASMTKPITSVAIMMLYEEGYFQLDEPVSKFIPEFKNVKVLSGVENGNLIITDQKNQITIRDLLTHTSGLSYGFTRTNPIDSIYRQAKLFEGTSKDMIQKLIKIPLLYQPGSKFNYSVSTDVLGYLVEVISGKPLNRFLQERIFIPLKMTDTDFYVPENKLNRFAALYGLADDGIKVIDTPKTSSRTKPPKMYSGGGGLVSTISDYAIFAQMLLNKGEYNGIRLLGSKTVEFMTRNHLSQQLLPVDILPGFGFGLGFSVMINPSDARIIGSEGEFGWSGAFNTFFWIDPEEKLIMILMTQFNPFSYYPIRKEFQVLVYQAIID